MRNFVNAMVAAGELPPSSAGGAVNADALALPFPDATFDRIIASEVLEHIWADELAISELVRILRPGGRLAVTVPTRLPERVCWALDRNYHDMPGGHIRIYRQRDLEAKLGAAGLEAARRASCARAPLSLLVAEVCGWGQRRRRVARPQVPRLPRVADRETAVMAEHRRPHLEPRDRQEPGRLHGAAGEREVGVG